MPYRSAYSDSTRRTAIRLRREATFPERLLWSRLKRQQAGIRFLRQRPLGRYVAYFYAPACKLVVELDGRSHEGRFAADLERERFLRGGCASSDLRTTRCSHICVEWSLTL